MLCETLRGSSSTQMPETFDDLQKIWDTDGDGEEWKKPKPDPT